MAAVRHLGFSKMRNFNCLSGGGGQYVSACQISSKSVKWLLRYRDFSICKMAAVRHLGFSKMRNFNGRSGAGCPYASACQISSKSVKRLLRYGDFSIFQDGGRPQSWICYVHLWTTHQGHWWSLLLCKVWLESVQ